MKLHTQNLHREHGTVLFVTLSILGILGILIGSYLALTMTQRSSVARAHAWNNALVVAESGIEEGMAHINSFPGGVTTNNLATNNWTSLGWGIVAKTNYVGTGYSYVTIQIQPAVTNPFPVITSTAYVPGPVDGPTLSRIVQINTRARTASAANGAIVVATTVDLSGSGVIVDSFNSSDPNYSTGGQYDPNKRLANGDIVTTSSASNAVYVGDSTVYGTIHTAPGGVVGVDTGNHPLDSVGDLAWVNGGNIGIESGHALQDENYSFNDVTLPAGATWSTVSGGAKYKFNVGGTQVNFDYQLSVGGTYVISNLSSSVYVGLPGGIPSPGVNVTLYVPNSFGIPSGNAIYIAPGASLTMYVGAPTVNIAGQGIVNTTGLAADFQYFGLPTNTSLGLQANASFTGLIDAPEAFVSIGGGGSTTNDFAGQIIANSAKLNGHMNVHFDQALGASPAFQGYAACFWAEL
jgi:hypothetical protein